MTVTLMIPADQLHDYQNIHESYIEVIHFSKPYVMGGDLYINIIYEFDENSLHVIFKDFFHAGTKMGIAKALEIIKSKL